MQCAWAKHNVMYGRALIKIPFKSDTQAKVSETCLWTIHSFEYAYSLAFGNDCVIYCVSTKPICKTIIWTCNVVESVVFGFIFFKWIHFKWLQSIFTFEYFTVSIWKSASKMLAFGQTNEKKGASWRKNGKIHPN